MESYLLLWNPDNPAYDPWEELPELAAKVKCGRKKFGNWVVKYTPKYERGDRLYILKVGRGVRGIMGSGKFTRRNNETSIRFEYTALLNPYEDEILAREDLMKRVPNVHWSPQASGINLNAADAAKVESLWNKHRKGIRRAPALYPDEISDSDEYPEGTLRRVMVNIYERNVEARQKCKRHYGAICRACGLDFGGRYGKIGVGFIHVHHIKLLSTIGKGYKVNPIKDLIPVCPNCHAMLHRNKPNAPPFTVVEMRRRLRKQRI